MSEPAETGVQGGTQGEPPMVACGLHGPCPPAFACQHVVEGVGCGYHSADDANPHADAWCDACERVRAECGGWNEQSESFAGIRMICGECQDVARYRNERPVGALELGAPAAPDRVHRFGRECMQRVRERSDGLLAKGPLARHDRWEFDDGAGTLTLFQGPRALAVADVQLAGSFSEASRTWAWAWANPGNPRHLIEDSRRLEMFGRVRGIQEMLAQKPFPVDVERSWLLAAVATELLDGSAVYRAQMDDLHHFMVLFNLRRVVASRPGP